MAKSNTIKKYGVLIHHGLGDVIMAVPSILALDSAINATDTIYLIVKSAVEKEFLELLQLNAQKEIIVIGYSGRNKNAYKIIPSLFYIRALKIDYLFAIHATEGLLASIINKLLNAKISIGPQNGVGYSFTIDNTIGEEHKTVFYSRFIKKIFSTNDHTDKIIPYSFGSRLEGLKNVKTNLIQGENYILVFPGSSPLETHKRWSKNKFAHLVDYLSKEYDGTIAICGNKAEESLVNDVYNVVKDNSNVIKIYNVSIIEISYLISKSRMVIGNCSGSIHLASYFNVPLVAIYGPTNPSVTGPFHEKARIVRMEITCSPCYRLNFTHGCGNPQCMDMISVEKVYSAVKEELNNSKYPQRKFITSTSLSEFVL